MVDPGRLRRGRYRRVVHVTDLGSSGLRDGFGVPVDAVLGPHGR
ncbi:hypothetical protein [Streptomyces hoynatensis]|nr:hypothetical protein [Streptomyces hoynatensis]